MDFSNPPFDLAVIGSGIVGLSNAYAAARQGMRVAVFERGPRATGASIRNFGMVWPIGQPLGTFDRAMRSRETWLELSRKAGFWAVPTGSLFLAYHKDEMDLLYEFYETRKGHGYQIQILSPEKVVAQSNVVNPINLKGALWSATEINVDPREAITRIHEYLRVALGVSFFYNTAITRIEHPFLGNGAKTWKADQVFVCSGVDFETLYPDVYTLSGMTKCKLQMMRTIPQPKEWKLGPTLCSGLTLQHYEAFRHCQTLGPLKKRFSAELPDYIKWGIHVLVSQTRAGEITLGDSHEYGLDPDPFDKNFINQLILNYLGVFARFPRSEIAETWHGVYAKIPGKTEFIAQPAQGVTIVNGLGGAGMSLSFGLAEELLTQKISN